LQPFFFLEILLLLPFFPKKIKTKNWIFNKLSFKNFIFLEFAAPPPPLPFFFFLTKFPSKKKEAA